MDFRVLYEFPGGRGSQYPEGLVFGLGQVHYGTTGAGGTGTGPCNVSGCGTVFSLTPPASPGAPWTHAVIYDFQGANNGSHPGGVAIGEPSQGSVVLYGTTARGGSQPPCRSAGTDCGTVFALASPASLGGAWTDTVLYTFSSLFGTSAVSIEGGSLAVSARRRRRVVFHLTRLLNSADHSLFMRIPARGDLQNSGVGASTHHTWQAWTGAMGCPGLHAKAF